ncbi:HpcH/HpaI aldolase family protein [Jannaschia sp. LMIT008]|uniref:HpcH/HpaI aldolase family protein n=1 Tax=Jannaschia maritima TaxID=3032585 RepID=UPI002811E7B3|nr:aldolase/citrate lyase family protein [Jannaschia sp. LMIT008]
MSGPDAPLGTWLMSGSPDLAEAMACRGFDFLVIDMEHVPITVETVLHMARAVQSRGVAPVVRLPDHDPARIRWMMDAGLDALMVPMIDTPDQARAVAAVMDYPPGGVRGFAAMLRANGYGADPDYVAQARARACLIAQLETPSALTALEDVAAVDGVDALFVGPGDISATTGEIGNPTGDATLARIRAAVERAGRAGVPIGTVMPRPDLAAAMLGAGCGFAAVASDMGFAAAGAAAALRAVRAAPA